MIALYEDHRAANTSITKADIVKADIVKADTVKTGITKTSNSEPAFAAVRKRGHFKQMLARVYAGYQRRRADRLALQQLMQLDDYLLKDMGLERSELISIKLGSMSLDAALKKNIIECRDSSCSSTSIRR